MDDELLEALEEAWDSESGFLGKLRSGRFDPDAGEAYVALLSTVPPIGDTVDSRLVQLIWFAPTLIEWQTERATKSAAEVKKLERIGDLVREVLIARLGLP
ncbi:hypothetical protein SAMN04487904_107167 [Actinopolyspora lacussalsi subsp. righensis]|uniref:Uncharacterized protein n=1 Tax=Actinopolyspora righensis TaxID=995060 RepID=A0A1I7AKT9_9ACTN|nr:hypothetical protein [Actinopolyspora righensis]SFT75513.1 hypothetical protein SAMN04487904_107167 [Actinopolyspora righensis]